MEVIKTAALTKAYGAKRAVDHLDMTCLLYTSRCV